MKKLLLALIALLSFGAAKAQIEHPVEWSYAAKKVSATEAVLLFRATIQDGWHIYSTKGKDDGPTKTAFTLTKSPEYTAVGVPSEPAPITKYEKAFSMNVGYFEKTVTFQQKIKIKPGKPVTVKGQLEFMVCNDHKCLPPDDVDFTIAIK